jgi:outer membrane lipoprotein-sorting protein
MKRILTTMVVFASAVAGASPGTADEILARSRAVYASLRSYSDTGSVVTELKMGDGPRLVERFGFNTSYRAPRRFHFDFRGEAKDSKERFVVWSDDEAFRTWWSATGVESAYPKGSGASAFALADFPTKGAVVQVPALLFAGAGLRSALSNFGEASVAGTEVVDGKRCHKLTGVTRDVYAATQREVKLRQATVWIDVDTQLVRKIVEETPRGTVAGAELRSTTTFDPLANPTLDDAAFDFTPASR